MNKMRFAFLFLLISSFFCIGCGEDENANLTPTLPTKSSQNVAAPVSVPTFSAPASSAIDEKKAQQYANASDALVILGEEWSSKIDQAQGEEKVKILQNYGEARNQVCSRMGLAGIAEFNWITEVAVKDSSNMEIFAKVGIVLN